MNKRKVYNILLGLGIVSGIYLLASRVYRKYKSMTGIPFRRAASNEKLMTKVTEAGMTPRKFAGKVKKDYSNFFREIKGNTPLTLKQAMEYSKELLLKQKLY